MLIRLAVDPNMVVHRGLSMCALICCALVALSFAMFVTDRLSTASKQQATQVDGGQAPSTQATGRSQPRRFIDGAAETLTSPFRSLISTHSLWTEEGVSTFLALMVYGLGLGYLARYARIT